MGSAVNASTLVKAAVVLCLAAEGAILVAVGWDAVWLVATWGLAAIVLAVGARLVRAPLVRVVLCTTLVMLCVLLTFEGGLFFLPAATALLVAATLEWRKDRQAPA